MTPLIGLVLLSILKIYGNTANESITTLVWLFYYLNKESYETY